MAPNHTTTALTSTCLCHTQTFTTTLPTSSLPLQASICHCTSCRHTTGAMYTSDIPWPASRSTVPTSSLSRFRFSDRVDVLFCGNCGTQMFFDHPAAGDEDRLLGCFTGTVEVDGEGLGEEEVVRVKECAFVGDTRDGGAVGWVVGANGRGEKARVYVEGDDGEEVGTEWVYGLAGKGGEGGGQGSVGVRCKCLGVDFVLRKWKGNGENEIPSFVDPKTGKHEAVICGCGSCRRGSGVDLMCWCYTSLQFLCTSDGKALPTSVESLRDAIDRGDLGSLKYYESSADTWRFFCGGCGAKVFYATDKRPGVLDVAVGLLDSAGGARAEELLSWDFGRINGRERDSKTGWRERMLEGIEREMRVWRERRR